MTDVISGPDLRRIPVEPDEGDAAHAGEPLYELIELLFFAYRDFVGGPDRILAEYDFGRAHHRVLHFVSRNPGMRVTDLLDILKITKQSLARVLKQLVDTGFIDSRTGAADRRERLLYPTEAGRKLALRLASLQSARLEAATTALGPGGAELAKRFLALVVNEDERPAVLALARRESPR
jgi:DNA-binding MarR family transcriptional regulator